MWWLVSAVVMVGLLIAFQIAKENAAEATKREQLRVKDEEAHHHAQQMEDDLVQWAEERQLEGWTYLSRGKFMHVPGQPQCMMLMSETAPLLRFDEFSLDERLEFKESIYLNLNQVISLKTARPPVTRSRKEQVLVPVVETSNKSPVARGLIGGALLGPAGLVLGAASGLNAKTSTTVSEQSVYRNYESSGAPQLIIGTNSIEHPVLKFRCADQEVADGWLFRIRGRQSR